MTLFREAIQEVQRACINGNLEKAKIILNEHINAHHKTEDDLLNMIRKLLCYQEHLIFANELLKIKETSKEDMMKWNDSDIGIEWPIKEPIVISERDSKGQSFKEFVKKYGGIEL